MPVVRRPRGCGNGVLGATEPGDQRGKIQDVPMHHEHR